MKKSKKDEGWAFYKNEKDDFIEVMCPYCKRTLKRDWSIPDVCPYCKERVSNSLN